MMRTLVLYGTLLCACRLGSTALRADDAPADSFRLRLAAPIDRWDEAIPLGNGLTGGLLWGAGHTINLSLDRGDLWDERLPAVFHQDDWNYATIKRLKADGNQAEISRMFDAPYNEAAPTKLPGGRLVIKLAEAEPVQAFELDLRSAIGRAELGAGVVECFYSAVEPVALMRIDGGAPAFEIVRPAGLDRLGYAAAEFGQADDVLWMVQKTAGDLAYAIVVGHRRTGDRTLAAITITSSRDGADPLEIGRRRVAASLAAGYDALLATHRRWWDDFWNVSSVTIPHAALQRHYNLVKYFYGAASRPDAPPIPLQGVWTRDDGNLPPWKGDYHHDLNTQMTYLAYHTAGLTEAGLSFINYNWDLLPTYRQFAKEFYGVPGAAMPGVATLAGQPTAGWAQYALSPTNALWVAQTFYLHWRYTMDREFLETRAYPWMSEIARGITNLLEARGDKLYLPLSSSPEIHDNSLRAWLTPNSNYDLALMQWSFAALAEMAEVLDRADEAALWRALRNRLDELLVDERGALMFAANEPFNVSHRHHSHTMAIHPLGTLHIEGNARDRAIIDATLDRMAELGTQAWVGYSFSWFACVLARAGRADEALRYLTDYERAFILRNGFHVNGDQIGAGLSGFRYRPFTLEGNFLAMQAVHEMLLQSWGGRVRVFPTVPGAWREVSFERLRAEGGFVVSAERRNGGTTRVVIEATVDQTLRLKDPFAGRPFEASRSLERSGDELRCELRAGELLELTTAPSSMKPRSDLLPDGTRGGQAVVSLAGEWALKLDPDDVGETQRWFGSRLNDDTISLPGTTDLAGKGFPLDTTTMTYPVRHRAAGFTYTQGAPRMDQAGYLLREHLYIGKAWYQRAIDVPPGWTGRHVRLRLERVIWRTQVWIDDRFVGACDSLVAEHAYDLGVLEPGRHRLTICVDNDLVHNIGIIGHAYGPETQSRWNGIVGRIELVATGPVFTRRVEVYPAPDRRSVRVRAHVANQSGRTVDGTLHLVVKDERSGEVVGSSDADVRIDDGDVVVERTVAIDRPARGWDEFDPSRYELLVTLRIGDTPAHEARCRFGFRQVTRNGRHIEVNGRRVFLRGTLDCCVYPKTGHPPMTVEEWLRVLGVIKEHGFNHVRFHTWCPPEAAFEAADRLGIYLAPETPLWVDDWTADVDPRPRLPGGDDEVTEYVRDEIRRISEAYGNHPSFAFFCIGNEFGMSGDWDLIQRLLSEARERDPRRLYNASTARRRVAADDYWVTHSTGRIGTRGLGPPRTNWDFGTAADSTDLPLIAHETGQRPVFPNYDDLLPKFTGPLKPFNLLRLREQLADAGMLNQARDFTRASARFQYLQYKAEHEAFHRTSEYAGYQMLMLNDFTGQSEALVGVLDPFWEPKGVVSADEVRRWNAPTVALARFDRYTWTTDETLVASIEVAHFGPSDLADVEATWSLRTPDGSTVARGTLGPVDAPAGGVTQVGVIGVPLSSLSSATAMELCVEVGGAANQWTLWAYPPEAPEPDPHAVLIARALDDGVRSALAEGKRVLLLVHGLENKYAARAGFASVYWSAGWWGNEFSSLGVLCDPEHPALARFPNDGHSDWQWYDLTEGATTLRLDDAPADLRPIVQLVPDFHYNKRLGHVFEAEVGTGRLLVCGYDLLSNLERRHAARQFRHSLLAYMNSDAFRPQAKLSLAHVQRLLGPRPEAPGLAGNPPALADATLHVRAARRLPQMGTNVAWSPQNDEAVQVAEGYAWQVTSGGTWKDGSGSAWHGNPLRVVLTTPPGVGGTLYVHVHDWNNLNRRGALAVDEREYGLGAHAGAGRWLALDFGEDETRDGEIRVVATPASGPNLMITEVALVPRQ